MAVEELDLFSYGFTTNARGMVLRPAPFTHLIISRQFLKDQKNNNTGREKSINTSSCSKMYFLFKIDEKR